MKVKIIPIGNSQGIRIPKPLIEEAELEGSLEMRVVESGLLIERISAPRTGWVDAAKKMHSRGEDGLLDDPVPSEFDESEWEWE